MTKQYVFPFTEADPLNKSLFGGKGAGLAGMTQLHLPVPRGFIITTEACREYLNGDLQVNSGYALMEQVGEQIHELEKRTGLTFGQDLLVSVRSGAPVSMPGMMDTILNLGANKTGESSFRQWAASHARIWDELEQTWIESPVGDEVLWLRVWQQFLVQMGKVSLGMESSARLAKPELMYKNEMHIPPEVPLSVEQLREMVEKIYSRVIRAGWEEILNDPWLQLSAAIEGVFKSWHGHKAIAYRRHHNIGSDLGTAVNVVMMVYGNLNSDSGTGVMFTRNPATGENRVYGEYLPHAQGEAIVSGEYQPEPLDTLKESQPIVFNELVRYGKLLEREHLDIQDIEFTIQAGELFLLQHRSAKRTTRAALVAALDMVDEDLITQVEAIERVPLEVLNLVGKPSFGASGSYLMGTGLPASPGLVTGIVAYSSQRAVQFAASGNQVVLVRKFTSTEDIEGILRSKAIVTGTGGLTCHAAVVSRDLDVPCVVACTAVNEAGYLIYQGAQVAEAEWVSVNGHTGEVLVGKHEVIISEAADHYVARFKDWVGDIEIIDIPETAQTHTIGVYEKTAVGFTPSLEIKARNDKGWWDELILSLDITQLCADFYLLNDLTMRNSELKPAMVDYAEVLARQLAVYMDAACGGEARHKKGGFKTLQKGGSRALARKDWRVIRKTEGIAAMVDLKHAFFTPGQWGGAMGGKNWGNAADLLCRFLMCEVSAIMFVDLAMDLEHNTGCLFNKLTGTITGREGKSIHYGWKLTGLTEVLNLKFEGNIEHLSQLASPSMRNLVQGYNPGDTVRVEGAAVAKSSIKEGVVKTNPQPIKFSVTDIQPGSLVRIKMNARAKELRGKIGSVIWVKYGSGKGLWVRVNVDGVRKNISAFNVELLDSSVVNVIAGPYREYF